MATLIIGSNTVSDGQLVADFDTCDQSGMQLVKIVKNNVVHSAPGMVHRHGANFSEVINANGEIIARAEEVAIDVVRVTGQFGSAGMIVRADSDSLTLPNGATLRQCSISGCGTAIEIGNGGIAPKENPSLPRHGFRQRPLKR